jgi:outer membrane murein-binding lipoprotein Lpp
MNTREIVLVGAGVVVGYLLVGYMNKAKNNTQGTMESEEPMVDQAKVDSCNKAVADLMATAKFAAGADLEAIKKAQFDACMAKTV